MTNFLFIDQVNAARNNEKRTVAFFQSKYDGLGNLCDIAAKRIRGCLCGMGIVGQLDYFVRVTSFGSILFVVVSLAKGSWRLQKYWLSDTHIDHLLFPAPTYILSPCRF